MNTKICQLLAIFILVFAGCVGANEKGEGSGVGSTESDPSDVFGSTQRDFCDWVNEETRNLQGQTFTCGGDVIEDFSGVLVSDCEDFLEYYPNCSVADARPCFGAYFNDPCQFISDLPEACDALDRCTQPDDDEPILIAEHCFYDNCDGESTGLRCATSQAECASICYETACGGVERCANDCL